MSSDELKPPMGVAFPAGSVFALDAGDDASREAENWRRIELESMLSAGVAHDDYNVRRRWQLARQQPDRLTFIEMMLASGGLVDPRQVRPGRPNEATKRAPYIARVNEKRQILGSKKKAITAVATEIASAATDEPRTLKASIQGWEVTLREWTRPARARKRQ